MESRIVTTGGIPAVWASHPRAQPRVARGDSVGRNALRGLDHQGLLVVPLAAILAGSTHAERGKGGRGGARVDGRGWRAHQRPYASIVGPDRTEGARGGPVANIAGVCSSQAKRTR
jgi:hypothetical protein